MGGSCGKHLLLNFDWAFRDICEIWLQHVQREETFLSLVIVFCILEQEKRFKGEVKIYRIVQLNSTIDLGLSYQTR